MVNARKKKRKNKTFSTIFPFPVVFKSLWSGNVDEVGARKQDKRAADSFDNNGTIRFFVPVEISLDDFCGGPGEDDDGAMPHGVGKKENEAIGQIR